MPSNHPHTKDLENTDEIQAIVSSCAQGDIKSMRRFFEIYSEDIYNFPIRVFHLDEDQASDFFLYAFEKLKSGKRFKSYKGKSRFRTWFFTVLRNLVIDWMRTIKEVQTINLHAKPESGNSEVSIIENIADERAQIGSISPHSEQIEHFYLQLKNLPIETRTILKLSYLYYLNLEVEELSYLAEISGLNEVDLLHKLSELKNLLTNRALKALESIDKITALYVNITELKLKYDKMKKEISLQNDKGTRYLGPDQTELEKIEALIQKKRRQRDKLLEKQERGNFIIKTAHKDISILMNMTEGSICVQLNRIAENLK